MYIKSVIFFHSSDRIMRVIQHYNGRVEENLIKKMRKISSRLLMSCHLKNILIMLYNFVYIFFGLNAWDALKITWIKEWLCNDADGHFQMWAWKVMTFVYEAVEFFFFDQFFMCCVKMDIKLWWNGNELVFHGGIIEKRFSSCFVKFL